MTDQEFEALLAKAHAAATQAIQAKGPENPNAFDCGFAWVTINGQSPLAAYCRKKLKAMGSNRTREHLLYGDKGHPTGWAFWGPGEFRGQAVGHKEAGARAFRDVLAEAGYSATVSSRLD